MAFAKRVYIAAGIWGLLIIFPMYFLESRINEQQPPAITHPEYYYGFVGLALTWQILYLMIGFQPIKYRTIMLVAIFAKTIYGLAVCMLFAAGRVSLAVLVVSSLDLVWAALFAIAYGKTPERESS
jgi:hypothetical protein